MKIRIATAAAASLGLLLAGCGKKEATADTIATVNGETISTKDYLDYIERKNQVIVGTSQGPQTAQTVGTVGLQALRDLVDRKLVMQLAKEEGVAPTEAEIRQELDFRGKQRPDYVNLLTTQAGMTLDLIRSDIAFDLSREKLLTKGITVTTKDVDQYIQENPQSFMEPATASLLWIVVSEANKTKQVDQDLAVGQNFQTVATRYSEAPQARESGGAYPENRLQAMNPRLREIIEKTSENKTTSWIQDGKNFVKFYVQSKAPARPIKMDDIKKEVVRRQLAIQRGSLASDLGRRLQDKLKASKIVVSPTQLAAPWNQLFEQLKKDTSGEAAGGAAGTGSTSGEKPNANTSATASPKVNPTGPAGPAGGASSQAPK